jgi:hypothetical protein
MLLYINVKDKKIANKKNEVYINLLSLFVKTNLFFFFFKRNSFKSRNIDINNIKEANSGWKKYNIKDAISRILIMYLFM